MAKDAHGNTISGVSFTWESSDTNVLSVSDAGLATAVANGSAQVTAATDGVSSELLLTVQQSASSVELTAPERTLATLGETVQLQAEAKDAAGNTVSGVSFTWKSSDTNVLSVSDDGLATAVVSGSAQVTATTDGVSSELMLTVQQSAPQLAAAAFVSWDGGGGDFNWNNPLNWNTDALPGATDAVIIDVVGDITVTHSSGTTSIYSLSSEEALVLSGGSFAITAASAANSTLTLSGGILTGAGDLTVNGLLTWSGGTMSGTGKTIATGGMSITGNVFVGERTIDNVGGTAIWDPYHVPCRRGGGVQQHRDNRHHRGRGRRGPHHERSDAEQHRDAAQVGQCGHSDACDVRQQHRWHGRGAGLARCGLFAATHRSQVAPF